MSNSHSHSHNHSHLPHGSDEANAHNESMLGKAFALIGGFMLVEVIGGLMTNSLTLLADAGHMFLDATALGLSWYALRLSRRDQDHKLSYGYHRFQVLAAFVNGMTLIALVVWIVVEAIQRMAEPQSMIPIPALIIAGIGFVINLIAFKWLHGAHDNQNVRSAALHVLGDLLGSAAAIAAALIVYFTGWLYADPLLALVIAAILIKGAWRVVKDSGYILLEGVPHNINLTEIKDTLSTQVQGVIEIHHVHAWALTMERPLLTLHANIEENRDIGAVVSQLKKILDEQFGINHSTIQVEHGECPDHLVQS